MPSKGWRVVAVVVLVSAYLFLQRMASEPKSPGIALQEVEARQPFPLDFTLPDVEGRSVQLSEQHGKVILLNFWATWCYPCRTEMSSMQTLYDTFRDQGFDILAISGDVQGAEVVAPFVKEYGLTFPVLLDPKNVVGTQMRVQGIPKTYLLDRSGHIAGIEMGARDWNSAKMRRVLKRLLAERPEGGSS